MKDPSFDPKFKTTTDPIARTPNIPSGRTAAVRQSRLLLKCKISVKVPALSASGAEGAEPAPSAQPALIDTMWVNEASKVRYDMRITGTKNRPRLLIGEDKATTFLTPATYNPH